MTFLGKIKNLLAGSDKRYEDLARTPADSDRPPSTIRKSYTDEDQLAGRWFDLSEALKSEFHGKILKYFGMEEDLSTFQFKTGVIGLQLKTTADGRSRGYVIVGNEGYRERLEESKRIYLEMYTDIAISKTFDNEINRAGFYWEGTADPAE